MDSDYPIIVFDDNYNCNDSECDSNFRIDVDQKEYLKITKPVKQEYKTKYHDASLAYVFVPLGTLFAGFVLVEEHEDLGFITIIIGFFISFISYKAYGQAQKKVDDQNRWGESEVERKFRYEMKVYDEKKTIAEQNRDKDVKFNQTLTGLSVQKKRFHYRRYNTLNKFIISDIAPSEDFVPKVGLSEEYFYNIITNYYGVLKEYLFQNKQVFLRDSKSMYYPDLIFADDKYSLYIDIEIDERYTLDEKKPIHGQHEDMYRNYQFSSNGWIVIRFTENQIIIDPIGCMRTIVKIINSGRRGEPIRRLSTTFYDKSWELDHPFDQESRARALKLINRWNKLPDKFCLIENLPLNYANLVYRPLNFNLTCILEEENEFNKNSQSKLKHPAHAYNQLRFKRQTIEEFNSLPWRKAKGVGTVAGYNKLMAIDIDGTSSLTLLKMILEGLGLSREYEWAIESGSKNGFHILILSRRPAFLKDDDVCVTYENTISENFTIQHIQLLYGTHIVLPGSLHASRKRYEFVFSTPQRQPVEVNYETLLTGISQVVNTKQYTIGKKYIE